MTDHLEGLTKRELEVLTELATGYSNREIAARLHMSVRTVQKHLERIYQKLGVRNRTEAAVIACTRLAPQARRRARRRENPMPE